MNRRLLKPVVRSCCSGEIKIMSFGESPITISVKRNQTMEIREEEENESNEPKEAEEIKPDRKILEVLGLAGRMDEEEEGKEYQVPPPMDPEEDDARMRSLGSSPEKSEKTLSPFSESEVRPETPEEDSSEVESEEYELEEIFYSQSRKILSHKKNNVAAEAAAEYGWGSLDPKILSRVFDFLKYCDVHFCALVAPNWAKGAVKYWQELDTFSLRKSCYENVESGKARLWDLSSFLSASGDGLPVSQPMAGSNEESADEDGETPSQTPSGGWDDEGMEITPSEIDKFSFQVLDMRVEELEDIHNDWRHHGDFDMPSKLDKVLYHLSGEDMLCIDTIMMNIDSNIFCVSVMNRLLGECKNAQFSLFGKRGWEGREAQRREKEYIIQGITRTN